MERLLTPESVAEHLSLSRTTVFGLIKSGQLRSIKIGKSRRVPASAVDEFITQLQGAA
jgi:excisionase family DNA binding protein